MDIPHHDLRFPWAPTPLSPAWFFAVEQLGETLAHVVNCFSRMVASEVEYYLVLEASHFHLEITLHGEAPNIQSYETGRYFYTTHEVTKIMEKVG